MEIDVMRKVLIADDEPGVRRLLRTILGRDYRVVEAQNGKEAVDLAAAERPDIVLLDIIMPEMDGISACTAIKSAAATKAIPVIMISAVSYQLNKRMAESVAGASAYVTKPFSPKDILTAVADLLPDKPLACDSTIPAPMPVG
jgi:CheY-like chemotaxis protein